MPISFIVDAAHNLVRSRIVGTISLGELLEAFRAAIQHPDYRPGFGVLSDHREVGEPFGSDEVEAAVEFMKDFADAIQGGRWAIVTVKPASYGMSRMFAVMAQRIPLDVQVFRTLEEAERWLQEGYRAMWDEGASRPEL